MYKLLIIDDDGMIRNGIKNSIHWEDYSIVEVRTAENGEVGEIVYKEFLPDIVLTDIRMPGIDGLELLERIRAMNKETKVIMLSGYDEFTYAQKALQLGAFDYLLKTAGVEEVIDVINKAKEEIQNERVEKEEWDKLKQQLQMSLPLLRDRYLNKLIHGSWELDKLVKKMAFADLQLAGNFFIVCVSDVDDFSFMSDRITEEARLLTKLSIMNTMQEVMGEKCICFENKYEEFICIYMCEQQSVAGNSNALMTKCQKISEIVTQKYQLDLSIGISNAGEGLVSIKQCYEEGKKALEHRLLAGKGCIIHIKDIFNYSVLNYQMTKEIESCLVSSLRVGEKEDVLRIIGEIFDDLQARQGLETSNFHKICIELIGIASRVLCEFGIQLEDIYGKEIIYYEEIKKYKTLSDAKEWLSLIFRDIIEYILNTKIKKARKIIECAKQYIDKHYFEDISLNKVSEVVHMSPNYLSSLFSHETGQSFLEYVTMKRIEKAKFLLGEKDARAAEVGELVGYDNPYYFSRIFKKNTGMTPLEYKDNIG